MHYKEATDKAFCYNCIKAYEEEKLPTRKIELAFISKGLNNWKDASVKFKEHESSNCHKDSMVVTGVAKKMSDLESRAVYRHCYGHSLNITCMGTVMSSKVMQEALYVTREITKLVQLSPRRGSIFQRLKNELAPQDPGINVLCPTQWTVKAETLKSIVDNFEVLICERKV